MNSLLLGALVFLFLTLATLGGMALRARLPDHHLNPDSKDAIRLATAIVGTLSALALGLLIASAKSSYDEANIELRSSGAHVVLLDRLMAHYGPETEEARNRLRNLVERRLDKGWSAATIDEMSASSSAEFTDIEDVQNRLRALKPSTDIQRSLQTRALEVSGMVAEGHWLLVETANEGLPWAFLTILILWLALLFGTFGLQAPANPTVICILIFCALSVAGALFLIVEMADPYQGGLIPLSDAPLRTALARLGQP